MERETRLAALVDAIQRDVETGEVGQHHRHVRVDDAADVACALHEQMDQGVAARDELAARDGMQIACSAGCSACCENLIMVWEPEVLAVARYLDRPEHQAARASFLAAYPRWRERVGDTAARARAQHLTGDRRAYEDTVRQVWRQRIMCAFNRDGACTVYPVRPNVCRSCHAVDTSDRCSADSDAPPKAVAFPPLDEFLGRTQTLTAALEVTMRGTTGAPSSVCERVHELLAGSGTGATDKVGRNAPCPCDSGKKFKRCCGK